MARLLALVAALFPAAAMAQTYYGCYTEGTTSRALTGALHYDFDNLTTTICATYCTERSFSLWGTEYGGECYCGNQLTVGSFATFSSQCTVPCAGAANETCGGGGGHLSLYGVSPEPPIETPVETPFVTDIQYLGCHTEGNGTRALTGGAVADGTEMTIVTCGDFCLNRGFLIFGAEYMSECYCGNALEPSSLAAPETDCSMACVGDAASICGGPSRLSVYKWYDATAASP